MAELTRLRVYYEDTDAGGVVHHAAYVRFFERGRTEWLRDGGIEQRDVAATEGVLFAVRKITIEYNRPAFLDDDLRVSTIPVRHSRASIVFAQTLQRGECELATAEALIVCVRANPFRTAATPAALRRRLQTMIR